MIVEFIMEARNFSFQLLTYLGLLNDLCFRFIILLSEKDYFVHQIYFFVSYPLYLQFLLVNDACENGQLFFDLCLCLPLEFLNNYRLTVDFPNFSASASLYLVFEARKLSFSYKCFKRTYRSFQIAFACSSSSFLSCSTLSICLVSSRHFISLSCFSALRVANPSYRDFCLKIALSHSFFVARSS